MSHVAATALPVAATLFLLALLARGVLWARIDDEEMQRIARRSLEPLSTGCLVGAVTAALATAAAGNAGVLSLGVPLLLGAGAMLLHSEPATTRPAEVVSAPAAAPPRSHETPTPPASLWVEPGDESSGSPTGLWSRG